MKLLNPEKYPGVYFIESKRGKLLLTQSKVPGFVVHKENIINENGKEYRVWDPKRSKLSAAILKGIRYVPINENTNVLYLGAANGVTPSYISDIANNGNIYCVEISPKSMVDLVKVCEKRKNMYPIIANARLPEEYAEYVGTVDVIYEDVAQPDQAEILIKNSVFLKKGGYAMIAIKSQSIDVSKPPRVIYSMVRQKLINAGFNIIGMVELDPFEKCHAFLLAQKV